MNGCNLKSLWDYPHEADHQSQAVKLHMHKLR